MDFVQKVKLFNEIGGNTEEYNTRKINLYIGLCLEELAETISALNCNTTEALIFSLNYYSTKFKVGDLDSESENANRKELLDGFVDLAVVALGGGMAVGADIIGASNAVADNNISKFPIVDGIHTVIKDSNGKIRKPEGYKSVELESYLK